MLSMWDFPLAGHPFQTRPLKVPPENSGHDGRGSQPRLLTSGSCSSFWVTQSNRRPWAGAERNLLWARPRWYFLQFASQHHQNGPNDCVGWWEFNPPHQWAAVLLWLRSHTHTHSELPPSPFAWPASMSSPLSSKLCKYVQLISVFPVNSVLACGRWTKQSQSNTETGSWVKKWLSSGFGGVGGK